MKKHLCILLAATAAACNSGEEIVTSRTAENVDRITAYAPAPGQFINEPKSGFRDIRTAEEARAYAERRIRTGDYLSLGGWGGYVEAAFAASVPAADDYELWVRGNTQGSNTSEPGTVWVAQDSDGDGSSEGEIWYELRGSRHDDPETVRGYRIVYTRAADGEPTPWSDNLGGSGTVGRMDDFHTQPNYYPAWVESATLAFEGTRLPQNVRQGDLEGAAGWLLTAFEWGYADNTSTIDAAGQTNRFRIADAVTDESEPARLTHIDFIRVQTGVNAWNPVTGESSTEVCGMGCYRTATSAK